MYLSYIHINRWFHKTVLQYYGITVYYLFMYFIGICINVTQHKSQ